jgi:hypothetical protein
VFPPLSPVIFISALSDFLLPVHLVMSGLTSIFPISPVLKFCFLVFPVLTFLPGFWPWVRMPLCPWLTLPWITNLCLPLTCPLTAPLYNKYSENHTIRLLCLHLGDILSCDANMPLSIASVSMYVDDSTLYTSAITATEMTATLKRCS